MCAEKHKDPHENPPLLLSKCNQKLNESINFSKLPSIKFHEKPFSGCGPSIHGQIQ